MPDALTHLTHFRIEHPMKLLGTIWANASGCVSASAMNEAYEASKWPTIWRCVSLHYIRISKVAFNPEILTVSGFSRIPGYWRMSLTGKGPGAVLRSPPGGFSAQYTRAREARVG